MDPVSTIDVAQITATIVNMVATVTTVGIAILGVMVVISGFTWIRRTMR